MNNVSTNKTVATNVRSTVSINCHNIKKRLLYFAHCFYSDHITIDNCYYLLLLCLRKRYKIENNELKNICIRNSTCYHFDDIIKLEHFNLDKILIDEISHENILIYDISCKILTGLKLLRIRFDKIDGIIRTYDGTRCLTLFGT